MSRLARLPGKRSGVSGDGPDLRTWMATLQAAGQLCRVTAPVDWNEEIGAITRANLALGGPALLFENIAGYENTRCTKFLTSAIGNRRQVQLMLGLPEGTSDSAIVGHPKDTFTNPVAPHVVQNGPVENIVVEGYLDPDPATSADEGPFAEYPGYLDGPVAPSPVLRVTRITHRNDPVLRGSLEGMQPGFLVEDSMVNYARSAIAWNVLEGLGVRGVTDVWMSPVSNGTNLVVQIHKAYRGHAQQVAAALWGTSGSIWFYKNVMVVEEDIDIRDAAALNWAMAHRVNAGLGDISFFGPSLGSPPDPSTPPHKANMAKYGSGEWHRVLIDATRSWEFEPRPEWNGRHYPAINTIAAELEARITARRDEYGIGIPYLDDHQRELLTMEQLSKRLPDV